MADFPYWLQILIFQLPTYLVALLGIILALVNMGRAQGASLMALLGCGGYILTGLFSLFIRAALMEQLREGGMQPKRFGELSQLVSIAAGLAYALSLALIVIAAFIGRGDKPKLRFEDEEV